MCEYGNSTKFLEVTRKQLVLPYFTRYSSVVEFDNVGTFKEEVGKSEIRVIFRNIKRDESFNNETSDRAIKKCRR